MRPNAEECPARDLLSAYFDGELPGKWRLRMEDHLSRCSSCRAALLGFSRMRDLLCREPEPPFVDAMARVRNAVGYEARGGVAGGGSIWRQRLAVPVPLAAAAGVLLLVLAAALGLSLSREPLSTVRFTTAPTGLTQFEIEGEPEDVRRLLEVLNRESPDRIVIFNIPKDYHLVPLGEPVLRPASGASSR